MERQRVVSAVITRIEHGGQRKVLLAMRDGRSDFSNHWECPGGKVEPGETNEIALRRELLEELGVSSLRIDAQSIGWVTLDPPEVSRPLLVTFYHVAISPDDPPRALQARCLAWFEPEALDSLLLMPANKALCEKVKEACGATMTPWSTSAKKTSLQLYVCSDCPLCHEGNVEGRFYCDHPEAYRTRRGENMGKLDVFGKIPDWCPIRKGGLQLVVET